MVIKYSDFNESANQATHSLGLPRGFLPAVVVTSSLQDGRLFQFSEVSSRVERAERWAPPTVPCLEVMLMSCLPLAQSCGHHWNDKGQNLWNKIHALYIVVQRV
jgi:hypothetical protein